MKELVELTSSEMEVVSGGRDIDIRVNREVDNSVRRRFGSIILIFENGNTETEAPV